MFSSAPRWRSLFIVFILVALLAVSGNWAAAQEVSLDPDLMATAQAQGRVRVIVTLGVANYVPDGTLSTADAEAQQARIATAQAAVEQALANVNANITHRYTYVPQMAMGVDAAGLEALQQTPGVVRIQQDTPNTFATSSSVPVINGDDVRDMGYTGYGWAVAVLDTGVQNNHPWFGNRVVAEACFNSTTSVPSETRCPNGQESMIGTNAANDDCEDCGHGTHVAGIAAGRDPNGVHIGVAPDADIIAVNVFSAFPNEEAGRRVLSWDSDVIAGMDYVYGLRSSYKIAAVNVSMEGALHSDTCDDHTARLSIDNLRSAGIATVIASGNSGSSAEITAPACVSSAISVGATTDTDSVTYFSNVSGLLDVYAPGSAVTSATPGSTSDTFQGTSVAAPHVTGAWAVLKQRYGSGDVDMFLNTLASTGVPIDARGYIKPRIDLLAAVNATPTTCTPTTVGVYRGSDQNWLLRYENAEGYADNTFAFDVAADDGFENVSNRPDDSLVGDWDGDGYDTVGIRRGVDFYLKNTNGEGEAEITFSYGLETDIPIVGDWDGNGTDTIGLYRPSTGTWHLRNSNASGDADITFPYGLTNEVPLAGDWNGDGVDTIGVYRVSDRTFFLRNRNSGGNADMQFQYGTTEQDIPIVGDWNGDCIDTPGVYRADTASWYLRNANNGGFASLIFNYGPVNELPVVGEWAGATVADAPTDEVG